MENKKKILFIEPSGDVMGWFARFMAIPFMGPVYLATIARNAGHSAVIFNEHIMKRHITTEEMSDADILCLSCISSTVNRGKEIADEYRETRTKKGLHSHVIVGGIHASMMPEDVENHFDQIVIGEAEEIFIDLIEGRNTERIVQGERLKDINSLPYPDYTSLINYDQMVVTPVMTSRGCPYDCSFCSVTEMFGRSYRFQSPERVMEELLANKKEWWRWILFVDDNFAAGIDRTDRLLDLMIKNKFNIPWSASVRTEITKHPDLVAKMRRAGCKLVYIGFESVNPDTLKDYKKKQTVEDIKRSIKVFRDNHIIIYGMFTLGNDTDQKDIFKTTAKFSRDMKIDISQFSVLTPLPGTRIFKQLESEGRLLHKDWSMYDGLHSVFEPKNMTAYELQNGMIESYADFYTYRSAADTAVNTMGRAVYSTVKSLYSETYFPSFYPSMTKILGRKQVREWITINRDYLSYLKGRDDFDLEV